MSKPLFTADMERRAWETPAQWANRLKAMRGGLPDVEWWESSSGELRLRPIRNPQSKLDF